MSSAVKTRYSAVIVVLSGNRDDCGTWTEAESTSGGSTGSRGSSRVNGSASPEQALEPRATIEMRHALCSSLVSMRRTAAVAAAKVAAGLSRRFRFGGGTALPGLVAGAL